MPAAQHHEHSAHEHHTHDGTPVPPAQPPGDCPHCLGGHAAGNVTTADCDAVGTARPTIMQDLAAARPVLPIASYEAPAASAIPPLIGMAARATSGPAPSVPLHIRHCVLLI